MFKKIFFPLEDEVKFCNFILSLFKIIKACCIYEWLHSVVYTVETR